MTVVLSLLVALVLAPAARGGEASASTHLKLTDVAAEAGLTTPTWCGRPEKPHILESGGTGLALLDYDLDGDLDLYLVNGWRLEGSEVAERGRNALFRNRGDGVFEEVTAAAGVGDDGWGTGVGVGDVDGDGLPDLFVSNFGPDVLYRNLGDGSFEPLAGAPSIDGWSTGAVFFDADGDGDQDLYLGGYIDCTTEEVLNAEPELDWEGMKVMLGPFGLEGLGNRFFRNLGGGRFEDATESGGFHDIGLFYSFGVVATDLDGDLDLDLYVANDSNPNYVYENDGGRFQEVGLWSGAALDAMGNAQAGMGLAVGDLDDDGLPDLLVTNFYKDASTLYRNLGDLVFEDVSRPLGVSEPSYWPLSWGTTLSDLDLDGDLDVFIANGHIYPQADRAPQSGTSFRQRNSLLEWQGQRFREVGAEAGLETIESSRGLAVGDIDADGDLDLAVSNVDAPPTLLRNDSIRGGSWLIVDAPGAVRASVGAGERVFERHWAAGASFLSVSDPRFHFGLGPATEIERVTLERFDGRRISILGPPADRALVFPRLGAASH